MPLRRMLFFFISCLLETAGSDRSTACDGCETLISAQPLTERLVPNQAQADSGDAWTKDAADTALYDGDACDGSEVRAQSKNRECQSEDSGCSSKQCAL